MLAAGSRLGPYTILAPLGAGGMGEVYRARDPRLGREVAVKVLPAEVGDDPGRLRRFEQEARAASALNHPNILTVFDTGSEDGTVYLVTELLEGETLRERLAGGALPIRKAVEIGVQIVRGLAAAHEKGIVHRDLKPENLFLTRDGRVKILDFGLARLQQSNIAEAPTILTGTEPGVVLGTVGYMAPEQVRGQPADHRADVFALGAVLYEMLTGRRAFHGDSAAETMTAILREEPPEMEVPPGLDRMIRRCLEKEPHHRFQSASDLAFGLESLSALSGTGASPARTGRRRGWLRAAAAGGLLLALAFLAGVLAHREWGQGETPRFRRLTFRRGIVGNARFAPDGQTIVYSAAWDGRPDEIFTTRTDNTESRSLGLSPAVLHSLSPRGEMLVALVQERNGSPFFTLAQVALAGGAPRPILEGRQLRWADWAPGGESLAVLQFDTQDPRIEYPRGKVIRRLQDFSWDLRVSPDGDALGFCERRGAKEQVVVMLDRAGRTVAESTGWSVPVPTLDPRGCVAWSPDGKELWFAASRPGGESGLYALSRGGEVRPLLHVPGNLALLDVARDGRVLLAQFTPRSAIVARAPGESEERDLSWLGTSQLADFSADGRRVLFTEYAQGGSDRTSVYIRGTDGSPAVRLGDGWAHALSPDGRWALAQDASYRRRLFLLPTGVGEPRMLPPAPVDLYGALWRPGTTQILFCGYEPGKGLRLYVRDAEAKEARPLAYPGFRQFVPSPDGSRVAIWDATGIRIYPIDGGEPHAVPRSQGGGQILQWRADGRALYKKRGINLHGGWIDEIDIATGKRVPWKELRLADPAGALMTLIMITPDGRAYAYTTARTLSTLYLAEGLR